MEFIVKIGADQTGLNDMITRMKDQFKTMNVSTPESWGPAGGRGAVMKMSAGQSAFLRQQEESAASSLSGMASQAVVTKGVHLLKGLVLGQLASLAAEALNILGTKYWESVYGADEETISRIKVAHERISKSFKSVMSAREKFEGSTHESVLKSVAPATRMGILQRDLTDQNAEVAKREAALDYAKGNLAEATDINGKSLEKSDPRRTKLVAEMADAETKLSEAREKSLKIKDALRAATDEKVAQDIADAKDKERAKDDSKKPSGPADVGNESPNRFQADALAQAGLFAGSSLLSNPNLSVQMEQLEVMRQIAINTGRVSPWTQ